MSEFLMLPKDFIDYVAELKQIPIPTGTHVDCLQSAIELVCLEVSMGTSEKTDCPPQDPA
jgi:hypothetical protein